jgi:hypothetical protein
MRIWGEEPQGEQGGAWESPYTGVDVVVVGGDKVEEEGFLPVVRSKEGIPEEGKDRSGRWKMGRGA